MMISGRRIYANETCFARFGTTSLLVLPIAGTVKISTIPYVPKMADVHTGENRVSHQDWRKGQLATEAAEWQDVIRKRRENMVSFLPSLSHMFACGSGDGGSLCGAVVWRAPLSQYQRAHPLSACARLSLCFLRGNARMLVATRALCLPWCHGTLLMPPFLPILAGAEGRWQ